MVTTRSKDKHEGDAAVGEKREVSPAPQKEPAPKHQKKQASKEDKGESEHHKTQENNEDKGEPHTKKEEHEKKPSKSEPESDSKNGPEPAPGSETATIQEKGLIYFFTRPRVDSPDPKSIADVARSFFVLRPTDGDKPPAKDGQSRLCIIPKKILPTSGRQRWIGFVEKGDEPWEKATGEDLAGKDYETKTVGHRHVPDAMQVGEGIYAITRADRTASLVYLLTQPKELGEVQVELGLKERGYFTISTRNPTYPAPKGVGVSGGPEYPQEIMNDFQSLRWIPTQPRHLNYPKTQFLLIGHSSGIEKAFEPDTKGAAKEKKPAEDEVTIKEEELEGEEDLLYDIKEDEVSKVLLGLEKYAHQLKNVETEF